MWLTGLHNLGLKVLRTLFENYTFLKLQCETLRLQAGVRKPITGLSAVWKTHESVLWVRLLLKGSDEDDGENDDYYIFCALQAHTSDSEDRLGLCLPSQDSDNVRLERFWVLARIPDSRSR